MNSMEFNFKTLEEVVECSCKFGLELDFSENIGVLGRKVVINGREIPNSLAFHPMEGCDGNADGRHGELTKRRYERFSRGGAGLIWFEAVAVVPEGRGNPRHLWIHKDNVSEYEKLVLSMRQISQEEYGKNFNPVIIMQLTHAGRYSKPNGKPEPIIASHNPYLDAAQNLAPDYPVVTDNYIEKLEEKFVEAALLAKKAGFDGVDIKACHRYLNSELLSSFEREGKYGGSFEGRTRFIMNVTRKVREAVGKDFIVTTRMNAYDGIQWPYGWGVDKEDYTKYDLSEPLKLIKMLYDDGMRLINITMGNPYYNPHVNRPFDVGAYVPPEHPIQGVGRIVSGTAILQKALPDMAIVGSGYSWLRQFSQNLAAGNVEKGNVKIVGFGRMSFAYPDFARDILQNGGLKKNKCCISCSKCTAIMRGGGTTGCVIRDSEVYLPIFRKLGMGM